jgi:hypothetical protein
MIGLHSASGENFIHLKDLSNTTEPTGQNHVGKMVRNTGNGAVYLVKADGKRYHVPSGEDGRPVGCGGRIFGRGR